MKTLTNLKRVKQGIEMACHVPRLFRAKHLRCWFCTASADEPAFGFGGQSTRRVSCGVCGLLARILGPQSLGEKETLTYRIQTQSQKPRQRSNAFCIFQLVA